MTGARGRLASTLGLFALSLGFLAGSLGLNGPARRVPLPVSLVVVVLLLVQLLRERRSPGAVGSGDDGAGLPPGDVAGPSPTVPAATALAWVLALPLAILVLGLYAGSGLYVLAFVRVRGRESWAWSLGVAAVAACAVWGLVGGLLGATPPAGLFGALGAG